MSQNSPTDSRIQSSKTPGLKPALALALGSLEVQLDQELARYRRSRMASKTAYPTRAGSYISTQSQEPTEITASGKVQLPVTEVKTSIPPTPATEAPLEKVVKTEEVEQPQQQFSTEFSATQIPLPSPSSISSIVPAIAKPNDSENLIQANGTPTQPNDYLESSEALLRSLKDEPQQATPPISSNDTLLSPLGIGSMLLLLMASLTLGYVVFNPKGLPQFSLNKIFPSNSPVTTTDKTQPQPVNSQPQPSVQTELTPIPKYPNLAAKEFPELNNPNDIVGLQPKLPPKAIAPVNPPVVIPTPVAPPVINPLPEVQPVQPLNIPPISTAEPSPSPTVNSEIKPGEDGLYHIVMDNNGDRTVADARLVVPDAYLSRDRTIIYLGALKTKEQVQKRLKELESKGIKARVQ